MKYESGFTPVPQDLTSPYSAQQRQEIVDGLRDRLSSEEARIEERRDNFYNTLLPLCDITSERNRTARQVAYRQNHESDNLFAQWKQHQQELKDLQYQQMQRRNEAMSQYSGVGMRAQRDRAGAEAGAEFDAQIAQAQGLVTESFEEYSAQRIQAGLANQSSTASRFEQISAYNDAISEGFSLASDTMNLGKIQRQIGFFEGMA